MSLSVHRGRSRNPILRRATSRRTSARLRRAAPLGIALCALLATAGCTRSIEDQLAEVRVQQEIGSYKESVDTLRAILDEDPNNPEANFLLGSAQLALGQPALAIWPLELATRAPEFAVKANLALGSAYLQLDQSTPAVEAADRVLDDPEASAEERRGALRLRAAVHLQDEQNEEVIADVERLLAEWPEDADGLSLRASALLGLGRTEEAAATMQQIWESPAHGETAAGARAGMGLVRVYQFQLEEPDRAAAQLEAVLERFPGNQNVIKDAMWVYEKRGEPERAEQVLRDEIERDPSDMWAVGELAQRLVDEDRGDEAREVVQKSVDLLDTPSAWLTLSAVQRLNGDYDAAIESLDKAYAMLPGISDNLLFRQADLLTEAGRIDDAAEVASKIEEDFYREIMQGRIEFERGNPERSLELLSSGLERWPNNAGARYLAAKAALRLGRMDRAVAELREAVRVGKADTDAGLELALLHLQMKRPDAAVALLQQWVMKEAKGERQQKAQRILAHALWESGRKKEAIKMLAALVETTEDPQHRLDLVLTLAELQAEARGPAAAVAVIGKEKVDLVQVENERALRALAGYLIDDGKTDAALEAVDAAIGVHPDYAPFHDLRARVLANLGRDEEAARSFARALELDPDLPSALAGQAALAQRAGDDARAVELLDEAAAADESNAEYPYSAAQVELARGHLDAAVERLNEALRRQPTHAFASNDLAWILAERGEDLDRALALAKLARAAEQSAAVLDTLGWVQLRRDEPEAAVLTLEEAHALDPDSPSISYRLGLALSRVGESERARTLWEEALASGPFPESEAAQSQLAQLEAERG